MNIDTSETFKNRIKSDINLLVNAIDIFIMLYPQGYEHYLLHADQAMHELCLAILKDDGFSLKTAFKYVNELTLFHLLLCLEVNIISQSTDYSSLKNGYLTKVLKVFDGNKREIFIYNKVHYKTYKYKFYFSRRYY
jgi:hypothetical protein